MPIAALDIAPGYVPATETTLFTVPASTEYDVPVIRFVNSDNEARQLTLYNKQSGSGDNSKNEAVITINPQSTYEHGPMVLAAGRIVSMKADVANKINQQVHGWAIT
jgi:hypothetical protein